MTQHRLRPRRGLTLIEMMMSLVIFSFVVAGAVLLLRSESRSFSLGSERVAMYQNGRFALNEMEKDLRTSGAGAPDMQPQLIYLADSVIVFNANYWTNTPNDVEAVYYNPDAPDSAVAALRTTTKITLPHTAIQYPDTNYRVGANNSPSETISFYFARDASTTRTDDWILWRRVNNLAPEIVSTNIARVDSTPFFRYFRVSSTVGGVQSMSQLTAAQLPMRHTVPVHLSIADTGALARIDSVRAVRVTFSVSNGKAGAEERFRTLSRLIRLPNAGLANTKSCGDAPIFTATPVGIASILPDSSRRVRLAFVRSVDEASGERDVERYVVWRRMSPSTDWGDPLVTIPGGDTLYVYNDFGLTPGETYRYAVAAQDCTPTLSGLRETADILIP
jgi:prepilin-type N-terminal cleavage/methylation domain-containing protein